MIGIPIGLMVANETEWTWHKHIAHGLGRNKKSMWSFHWHEHHRDSRKNGFVDPSYQQSRFGRHAQGKENVTLLATGLALLPLFPVAPFFTATCEYSIYNYFKVHKKGHVDPEWARKNIPWHYDHHMGPNQEANFCITKPWFDALMGTREHYIGTDREKSDIAKKVKR